MSAVVKHGDKRTIDFFTNLDLTGATLIEIRARQLGAPIDSTITLPHAVIGSLADGHLTHTTDGTLAVGEWRVEVKVTFSPTRKPTIPSEGFETIEVTPDLG